MAIDQKVRTKQDSKSNCLDDFTSLSEHYNTTRAAKEVAEKELAKVRRQVEEARQDWQKKIRERRREVRTIGSAVCAVYDAPWPKLCIAVGVSSA